MESRRPTASTRRDFHIPEAGIHGEFHTPAPGQFPEAAWGIEDDLAGPEARELTQDRPELPLAVLLHNGFDSSISWEKVIPFLLGSGFSILAYDRSGYGKSFSLEHSPEPDCNMVARGSSELDLVLDHAARMGMIRPGTPVSLLAGHCMGGAIALDWSLGNPGRVKRLVLEAMGFASSPAIRRRTDWVLQPWKELDSRIRDHLLAQHGDHASLAWEHIHRHRGSYVMHPEWDQRPRLAELDCPVLIMQGGKDFYFRPAEAEDAAARIRQGQAAIFPDSSHDLHMRHTEEFLACLKAFLEANPGN